MVKLIYLAIAIRPSWLFKGWIGLDLTAGFLFLLQFLPLLVSNKPIFGRNMFMTNIVFDGIEKVNLTNLITSQMNYPVVPMTEVTFTAIIPCSNFLKSIYAYAFENGRCYGETGYSNSSFSIAHT